MPSKVPQKQNVYYSSSNNSSASSWATTTHGFQDQSSPRQQQQRDKKPSTLKSIFRKLKPDFKTGSSNNNPPEPPSIRTIILQGSSNSSLDSFGSGLPGVAAGSYIPPEIPHVEEVPAVKLKQKKSLFKSMSNGVSGATKGGRWARLLRTVSPSDPSTNSKTPATTTFQVEGTEASRGPPLTNMISSEVTRSAKEHSKPMRRPPPPPVMQIDQTTCRRIDPVQAKFTVPVRIDSHNHNLTHHSRTHPSQVHPSQIHHPQSHPSQTHLTQIHPNQPPISYHVQGGGNSDSNRPSTTVDGARYSREGAGVQHYARSGPDTKEKTTKSKVQFNVPQGAALPRSSRLLSRNSKMLSRSSRMLSRNSRMLPRNSRALPLRDGNGLFEWRRSRRRSTIFVRSKRISTASSIMSKTSRRRTIFVRSRRISTASGLSFRPSRSNRDQGRSYGRMTRYAPRFSFGFLSGRRRNTLFGQRLESEGKRKSFGLRKKDRKWRDDEHEDAKAKRDASRESIIERTLDFQRLSPEEEAAVRAKERLFHEDGITDHDDDDGQWIEEPSPDVRRSAMSIRPMRVDFQFIRSQRARYRMTVVRHSGYFQPGLGNRLSVFSPSPMSRSSSIVSQGSLSRHSSIISRRPFSRRSFSRRSLSRRSLSRRSSLTSRRSSVPPGRTSVFLRRLLDREESDNPSRVDNELQADRVGMTSGSGDDPFLLTQPPSQPLPRTQYPILPPVQPPAQSQVQPQTQISQPQPRSTARPRPPARPPVAKQSHPDKLPREDSISHVSNVRKIWEDRAQTQNVDQTSDRRTQYVSRYYQDYSNETHVASASGIPHRDGSREWDKYEMRRRPQT